MLCLRAESCTSLKLGINTAKEKKERGREQKVRQFIIYPELLVILFLVFKIENKLI
jgi:hypothetical protein